MKRVCAVILWLVFAAIAGWSQTKDVEFAWDQNAPAEFVSKYTMYIGPAVGNWTITRDIAAPQYLTDPATGDLVSPLKLVDGTLAASPLPAMTSTVNLTFGKWYVVVTASNQWGESAYSNQVQTPPGKPNKPSALKRLLAFLGFTKTPVQAWEFEVGQ